MIASDLPQIPTSCRLIRGLEAPVWPALSGRPADGFADHSGGDGEASGAHLMGMREVSVAVAFVSTLPESYGTGLLHSETGLLIITVAGGIFL